MTKRFITDINNIKTAMANQKLVVFVGAGASADAGVPLWGELIKELKKEINIPEDESDYLKIAQMYYNERNHKDFIEKVRVKLKYQKVKYNEIHEAIFNLNPEHIITTNFDDLLEQVIKKNALPYSVVSNDKAFPYAPGKNLLVKIHGDLGNTDIVLKEDDYLNFSFDRPLTEAFIKSVFTTKVVLFLGYSFSDIDLKLITQSVRNILDKDMQNAYMIDTNDDVHPSQREYYRNKGINVICYSDANTESNNNYIKTYLLSKKIETNNPRLEERGNRLLNLLNFILCYDDFTESISERSIIDQLQLSLERFSDLRSLPDDVFMKIPPFKDYKAEDECEYYGLNFKTNNRKLYSFFNRIKKYNKKRELVLTSKKLTKSDREKLAIIVDKLNMSFIYHLSMTSKGKKVNSNYPEQSVCIKLFSETQCNCANCRFFRLDISSVFNDLDKDEIGETSLLKKDFEIAYINYKAGNIIKAIECYYTIASKSWETGRYIYYFISQYNIKKLSQFLLLENNSTMAAKARAEKIVDSIDTHKLLAKLSFLDDSQYKLLQRINQESYFRKAQSEIEDCFRSIIDIYQQYDNINYLKEIATPNYGEKISVILRKIIMMYPANYIIMDEFKEFSQLCQVALNGLLISYATDTEYESRFTNFSDFHFSVFVLYGDSLEYRKITKQYAIDEISIDDSTKKMILEYSNNFFSSFHGKSNFTSTLTKGQTMTYIGFGNNLLFYQNIRNYFNNILFFLELIDLKANEVKSFVDRLIDFLNYENFIGIQGANAVASFIRQYHNAIESVQYIKLIDLSSKKSSIYFASNSFFNAISFAFEENKIPRIEDDSKILSILYSSNKEKNNDFLFNLWIISNEKTKKSIKEILTKNLNEKFDTGFYIYAVAKGIFEFLDFYQEFDSAIRKSALKAGFDNIFEKAVTVNLFRTLQVFRKMDQNFAWDQIVFDNKFLRFLVDPENPDNEKDFSPEWLISLNDKDYYESLRGIKYVKEITQQYLCDRYNPKLAQIYIKYLS